MAELTTLEEQVMKHYNNGMLVKHILRKVNITPARYYKIHLKLREAGLITKRQRGKKREQTVGRLAKTNPKHYYYHHDVNIYIIQRKGTYYGCVKTEREAVELVKLLKECDWDKSRAWELKIKVRREYGRRKDTRLYKNAKWG